MYNLKGYKMASLTIRKNFNFEKDIVDKVSVILKQQNKNLTQVLTTYFKAIVKEPELLDTIEQKSKQKTASFIGMLDGKIGDTSRKQMKIIHNDNLS